MPADAPPHTPPSTPARLRRVPVPVVVRLAEKRVTLAEVRALAPGSLLTFEKGCEEPLDLFVANRRLARGEAVKIGENFGLKLGGGAAEA